MLTLTHPGFAPPAVANTKSDIPVLLLETMEILPATADHSKIQVGFSADPADKNLYFMHAGAMGVSSAAHGFPVAMAMQPDDRRQLDALRAVLADDGRDFGVGFVNFERIKGVRRESDKAWDITVTASAPRTDFSNYNFAGKVVDFKIPDTPNAQILAIAKSSCDAIKDEIVVVTAASSPNEIYAVPLDHKSAAIIAAARASHKPFKGRMLGRRASFNGVGDICDALVVADAP